jgi:hypothetical protein
MRAWPNRDPIGIVGGVKLYGFAGNNPVNFADSDGKAKGVSRRIEDSELAGPSCRRARRY